MRFLTSEQAARFILEDPDGYIDGLSAADLSARQQFTRSAYRRAAAATMRSPSRSQTARMGRLARAAVRALPAAISARLPSRIFIALFSGPYENRLPHTRWNVVFIPEHCLDSDDQRVARLFAHELVHVFQRYNPRLTRRMLRARGFRVLRRISPEDNIRANPDTDAFLYTNAIPEQYTSDEPASIVEVVPGARHPFEVMAYGLEQAI
jgi:hypothetical protein